MRLREDTDQSSGVEWYQEGIYRAEKRGEITYWADGKRIDRTMNEYNRFGLPSVYSHLPSVGKVRTTTFFSLLKSLTGVGTNELVWSGNDVDGGHISSMNCGHLSEASLLSLQTVLKPGCRLLELGGGAGLELADAWRLAQKNGIEDAEATMVSLQPVHPELLPRYSTYEIRDFFRAKNKVPPRTITLNGLLQSPDFQFPERQYFDRLSKPFLKRQLIGRIPEDVPLHELSAASYSYIHSAQGPLLHGSLTAKDCLPLLRNEGVLHLEGISKHALDDLPPDAIVITSPNFSVVLIPKPESAIGRYTQSCMQKAHGLYVVPSINNFLREFNNSSEK